MYIEKNAIKLYGTGSCFPGLLQSRAAYQLFKDDDVAKRMRKQHTPEFGHDWLTNGNVSAKKILEVKPDAGVLTNIYCSTKREKLPSGNSLTWSTSQVIM